MDLQTFLRSLDERRAPYRLERWRDAIMVVVSTPGSRWEVEFLDEGGVEIERFTSDGTMLGEGSIADLLGDLA